MEKMQNVHIWRKFLNRNEILEDMKDWYGIKGVWLFHISHAIVIIDGSITAGKFLIPW